MGVKALKCPSCGGPLLSTDVTRCQYCGSTLAYSVPQHGFVMKGKEGRFRGIARNVQQREENGWTVLSFRIEQMNPEGNVLGYTETEWRKSTLKGTLVDGDEVEVVGTIDAGGILAPKRVHNLTTNSYITEKRNTLGQNIFLGAILIIMAIFLMIFITVFLSFLGR